MGNRILVRQPGEDGGILAAQRRLRELGRIRSGWSEPYTDGNGKPRRRAIRSKTLILTSQQREPLDQAAEMWGGSVERWQPQGYGPEVWRLITERDAIDAILPPGDPLNQAYEKWSGGGCQRRCDGITEQISGKPCLCQAQHGEEFYRRSAMEVCRPTSRLGVFLDLVDFGLWRIETHSYYAMLEMAGTIDLIKDRIGPEPPIPVRLRIDQRARVVDGKTSGYPVIVVELLGSGIVSQILMGVAPALQAVPPRVALPAGPAAAGPDESDDDGVVDGEVSEPSAEQTPPAAVSELDRWKAECDLAPTVPLLQQVYARAAEENRLSRDEAKELVAYMWERKAAIEKRPPPAFVQDRERSAEQPATMPAARAPSREDLWMRIMAIAEQRSWDRDQAIAELIDVTGVDSVFEATAEHMQRFLDHLAAEAVTP